MDIVGTNTACVARSRMQPGSSARPRRRVRQVDSERAAAAVDEVDELHPEALEGPIPLAIPVRVWYQMDRGAGSCIGGHRPEPTRSRRMAAYDE